MPKTPKRQKPVLVLLERIQRFKMVDFISEVSFESTENDVQSAKTLATSGKAKAGPAGKRTTRASTRRGVAAAQLVGSSSKALGGNVAQSTPVSARTNTAPASVPVPEFQGSEVAAGDKYASPQVVVDPYAMEMTSTDEEETRKTRNVIKQFDEDMPLTHWLL